MTTPVQPAASASAGLSHLTYRQLREIVGHDDPGAMVALADRWLGLSYSLGNWAGFLQDAARELTAHWDSVAGDLYVDRLLGIARRMEALGDVAYRNTWAMHGAADSLRAAQESIRALDAAPATPEAAATRPFHMSGMPESPTATPSDDPRQIPAARIASQLAEAYSNHTAEFVDPPSGGGIQAHRAYQGADQPGGYGAAQLAGPGYGNPGGSAGATGGLPVGPGTGGPSGPSGDGAGATPGPDLQGVGSGLLPATPTSPGHSSAIGGHLSVPRGGHVDGSLTTPLAWRRDIGSRPPSDRPGASPEVPWRRVAGGTSPAVLGEQRGYGAGVMPTSGGGQPEQPIANRARSSLREDESVWTANGVTVPSVLGERGVALREPDSVELSTSPSSEYKVEFNYRDEGTRGRVRGS